MILIHLTAKRFAGVTADNAYIFNLAKQFNRLLGGNYLLIMANKLPEQLPGINCLNLNLRSLAKSGILYFLPAYIYYFFWLPIFIIFKKNNGRETVFFSNDFDLLSFLIFWKKIFKFKFKICSDWHMLFNNFKDIYVARNSDFFITTSEKLKKIIVDRSGVNASKAHVVYGGVDLAPYQNIKANRPELGLPEDKKLVGYVGLFKTMGMEKGIGTMIEALKYLSQEIIMVFVGARPGQAEEYRKQAINFGVHNRCIFFALQPIEKVPLYEKLMDILVIPYPDKPHYRDWGFPMKVYEYMASQRPIIYSDLELIGEMLFDCAVKFKPDEPKDLARAINYIFDEKNKIEIDENIKKSSAKALAYSWENKAEKIINICQSYN